MQLGREVTVICTNIETFACGDEEMGHIDLMNTGY